jgi:hypothetical protein
MHGMRQLHGPGRGQDHAAGYRHGFSLAAAVAGGLAVVAALLVPAVRPAPGTHVAVH